MIVSHNSQSHIPVYREIHLEFRPMTSNRKKIERKTLLKNLIVKEFGKDLKKIRERCENKSLLINAVFHLIESEQKGRSKPDLDNLLKILLDVLSTNMVNGQSPIPGVDLIKDDSQIYEIRCRKIPLKEDSDKEGLDLQVSVFKKD